jgi:type II secretory pathway component PulF
MIKSAMKDSARVSARSGASLVKSVGQWRWSVFSLRTKHPDTGSIRTRYVRVLSPFREAAHHGVGGLEGERVESVSGGAFEFVRAVCSPRTLSAAELANFFEAMGSGMTRSGNAGISLDVAARVARTPVMRGHVAALRHLVAGGYSLADAMKQLPGFTRMHAAITAAGEDSGNVGENFRELALRLQSSVALGRKLAANLAYPCLLLASAVGIAFFLGVGVVPKYARLYADMGADLPWVTKVFQEFGTLVVNHRLLIILLATVCNPLVLGVWGQRISRTELWHRLKLRIPVMGPIFAQLGLARSLQIYSLLSEAGLSAKAIFELVGAASDNIVIQRYFEAVYRRVYSGDSDAEAMAKEWPRLGEEGVVLAGKISVGRAGTGSATLMRSLAQDYQARAEATLAVLPQLISIPVMALMAIILIPAVLALTLPLPTLIAKQLQIMAQR